MSKLARHRRSAKSSSQTESMDNSDVTNGIPLPQSRRMGVPGSETWSALLDAAEKLMREKGYAAVTSRQLAAEAGLSPQIVYFYFKTMDDLFESLFKRLADNLLQAFDEIGRAAEPLVAMWERSCDPTHSVLMAEFMSLSNHRKQLQKVIGEFGVELNRRQAAIIESEFRKRGIDCQVWPPTALAAILDNAARGIAFGQEYAFESHAQAREFGIALLRKLGGNP